MSKFIEKVKENKILFFSGITIKSIYYNHILNSFKYFRCILVRKGLFSKGKYAGIEKFKNIHSGERCFIVGTAPSLTISDLDLLKNETTFSVNSVIKLYDKTDWRPTYYGIQDPFVYEKLEDYINNTNIPVGFVGDCIHNKYSSAKKFTPFFLYEGGHVSHPERMKLSSGFSSDVSEIVYDGYSIVYSLLQIAVYMGFKYIYLLGVDCSYSVTGIQHVVDSGFTDKQSATVGERMIFAHSIAKDYLDRYQVEVKNASRGGMLEVYERVTLEDILK